VIAWYWLIVAIVGWSIALVLTLALFAGARADRDDD
jgi:hypothetical protein